MSIMVERGHLPIRVHAPDPPPILSRPLRHPPPRFRTVTRLRLLVLVSVLSVVFVTVLIYLSIPLYAPSHREHHHVDTFRTPVPYVSFDGRPPQVCSHKVFYPSSSVTPLADSFPPPSPPSPYPLHASPPMLPNSLLHFLENGITCFDVDLFLTTDDVLFMGHPTDTTDYLTWSMNPKPAMPAPPALWVETLSSAEVERLDPLGYVPRFSVVVSELSDALSGQPSDRAPLSFITVEPKGRLNGHEGMMLLGWLFNNMTRPLASTFLLVADHHRTAAQLTELWPSVQLVLPLRDRGIASDSSAAMMCDEARGREEREAILHPYKYIWPSDKSLVRCGRDPQGGDDILQAARKKGKILGTWSAKGEHSGIASAGRHAISH